MTLFLSLLFGAVVGVSLGLTGGGGSIFAVPLLVYGLSVDPREAVGISLASVAMTSLVGAVQRLRAGEVETRAGLLFALAGMLGAPGGSWMTGRISESLLLLLFAGLMLLVAARMWWSAARSEFSESSSRLTCERDRSGRLVLTSRCLVLLLAVGLGTGILAGLFGVGGGFVIVPALVFFSGMAIHRAVATSLLIITYTVVTMLPKTC